MKLYFLYFQRYWGITEKWVRWGVGFRKLSPLIGPLRVIMNRKLINNLSLQNLNVEIFVCICIFCIIRNGIAKKLTNFSSVCVIDEEKDTIMTTESTLGSKCVNGHYQHRQLKYISEHGWSLQLTKQFHAKNEKFFFTIKTSL